MASGDQSFRASAAR